MHLILVLLLSATSIVGADGFETARLTTHAFGPVRVGMSVAEARRAGGVDMELSRSPGSDCGFLSVASDRGVRFMIEKGKVSRIDITDAHHPTLEGVKVGDTEARAQTVYARKLEVTPHKYDDHGHYFIMRTPDKKSALVFETDGKRITRMRAGVVPSVEYVEGCS